jgi:catechol 2,3-dioxygenase-like lactoylglutathione lyase family enzyme
MKAMIILFVSDQTRSKQFYHAILSVDAILDVPGMTEFPLSHETSLGLMPGDNIVTILNEGIPNPQKATGIPRCELYLFVQNPSKSLQLLSKNGGKIVSEVALRSWGDHVGYGLDPDGHLIAFAAAPSI